MKKKTVLIAGAGGLIGGALKERFDQGNVLEMNRKDFELDEESFVRRFESAELIMNFAGTPVIRRWNRRNRTEILQSRTETTRKLGLIVKRGPARERHYITASAIGIYPEAGRHTEESKATARGFLNEVVEKWEAAAMQVESPDCPVCILRLGVVLSRNGGMMKKVLPLFKAGLGGRIGNGQQKFSWIHMEDLLRAVEFIVGERKSGVYNLVSPGTCSNAVFTRELGRAVQRKAGLIQPLWALKLVYGQAAAMISGGPDVVPARLIREGFEFRYKEIGSALRDIVN